jgi:uncharacterized protein involved in outer membrane biogenesis
MTASSLASLRRFNRPAYWAGAVFGVLVVGVVLFLALFDWDLGRRPLGRYLSGRLHREVRIEGHLRVRLFSFTPSVRVEGLAIAQPPGPATGLMARVESVSGAVKLLPLLIGRVDVPYLEVEKPDLVLRRNAAGRANWDFSDPNDPRPPPPLKLPPIQRFVIDQGRVDYLDEGRHIAVHATVSSHERIGGDAAGAFRLDGQGQIKTKPFLLRVSGGPLVNVRRDRPYPFDADLRAGPTHLTAKGALTRPFDFGALEADLVLSGDDLNDVYPLTGLALPNSPPYRLAGKLVRKGKIIDVTGLSGRVGSSDVEGRLQVDTTNRRPYLDADLSSRLLDWSDVAAIFGAPGLSRAATPEQKAAVKAVIPGATRLLPDAKLKIDQLRAMDADVTYRAAAIKAAGLPLQSASVTGNLDEGVLKLSPLTLGFPQGSLTGQVTLDGRKDTPVTDLDMRLADVRIEQFLPETKGQKPVEGTLQARAKLTGAGDSVRTAAGAANGRITAVIPGGKVRQAFAELLGIDAAKGLFLLLNKDQHQTDIRCAVADFRVVDGVLRAQKIVVDTTVVVVNGSGSVSLKDESLDLAFKGVPTKFRLVRVLAPITVGGHLKSPSFGVDTGSAVAQAGLAVGIAALVSPLAVILPFVDFGTANNANCAALLTGARAGPAATSTRLAPQASAGKVQAAKRR